MGIKHKSSYTSEKLWRILINFDWVVQTSSVQTFQPIILMYINLSSIVLSLKIPASIYKINYYCYIVYCSFFTSKFSMDVFPTILMEILILVLQYIYYKISLETKLGKTPLVYYPSGALMTLHNLTVALPQNACNALKHPLCTTHYPLT